MKTNQSPDIIPHDETHRTLVQEVNRVFRCTLQRLEDGNWTTIATRNVDAHDMLDCFEEVQRLQEYIKRLRRRSKHRKANVAQDILDAHIRLGEVASEGEKHCAQVKQRVCTVINEMLEKVS